MIRLSRTTSAQAGVACMAIMLAGCGGDDNGSGPPAAGTGGTSAVSSTGGAWSGGGSSGTGGTPSVGGQQSTGGSLGTGGTSPKGGSSGTGGTSSGGSPDSGGAADGGVPPGAGGAAGSDALPGTGGTAGSAGGEPAVQLQGRFDMTDATKPAFSWSGSGMVARFQGTGATLRIDGSPNQFTVVIDGAVASQVLKVTSGTTSYKLANNLSPGMHDVEIWKRTEGNQGPNRFLGLDVTDGQLQAPPALPDRRIEIYGDSISAGYGIDGKGPNCAWSADTENHYNTYGALTARALRAELHTIAWSGIGMYRSYGSSSASSDAMPYVYDRTIADKSGSTWDLSKWQPHAVVINLGTNDASNNSDPGTPYETAYLGFVRNLRAKYPDTFFVLTIGPMLDGAMLTAMRGHIQKVISTRSSEGDTKMSYLEFPVQQQSDGLGCDWHPGPTTNVKMSDLLTAELKKRLGW